MYFIAQTFVKIDEGIDFAFDTTRHFKRMKDQIDN